MLRCNGSFSEEGNCIMLLNRLMKSEKRMNTRKERKLYIFYWFSTDDFERKCIFFK